MKYLFIGGCADGEHIETSGRESYTAAKRAEATWGYDPFARESETEQRSYYRSVKFSAGGSTTLIYVDESIYRKAQSQDDLNELTLHALIDGYRSPQEGEQRRPPPSQQNSETTSSKQLDLSSGDRDYKDAMRAAISQAMRGAVEQPTSPDKVIGTFMGQEVTIGEAMSLSMAEGCNCPVCTAKREGRPLGAEEMRFLEQMMKQIEQAAIDRALIEKSLFTSRMMSKTEFLEMYGGREQERRMEKVEMKIAKAVKKLAPPKHLDNSAPRRWRP